MTRRRISLLLPVFVLLPAIPAFTGGWAVTTVEHLPDYAVAGRPLTLTFTVRQHGTHPLPGLKPRIESVSGDERRTYDAAPAGASSGRYAGTVILPRAGNWTITIHSGFGNSRTTLVPLPAITPGSPAPRSLAEGERGRRLFTAKGCVTCHVETKVGPTLSGRLFTKEYVSQVLADPRGAFAGRPGAAQMPNLNLGPSEIAALAAYLSAEKRVAAAH